MTFSTIRPIKTEQDYSDALVLAYGLMDAKAGTNESDMLEVLSILIERYEQEFFPINKPDPVEAIKFRMEQEGLTVTDLGKIVGHKSRASEILRYKRKLTLPMIRKINQVLNIPTSILAQAY